jgi:hypothetical protein
MRHVGATRHGKRLGSPHLLRLMTGHRSTKMLETYINFAQEDVLEKLDATESQRATLPAPACTDPEALRAKRKARRLNTGTGSTPIETSNDEPPATDASTLTARGAIVVDLQALREGRGLRQPLPHAGEDPDAAAH